MPDDPAAASAVARRLADAGIGPANHVIVVHVSAGNPFRRWPAASFVESGVPARVKGSEAPYHPHVRSVRCRSRGGDRAGTRGPGSPQTSAQAIVECGEFDLAELRALIGRAALYIGGDSGPLHIAGTTGVPVVGLYGPTLPVRSQPFRGARFTSAAAEVLDLPCRPCNQRRVRARRFSLLDRNFGGAVAIWPRRTVSTRDAASAPEARTKR